MNNVIHTYDDLLKEKQRLEDLLTLQKARMKSDFAGLKEELRPANIAFSFASKVVTRDRHNPLLNFAIRWFSKFVLQKFVLARTGWFIRKILIFIFQNYASHAYRERADQLLFRILSLLKPAKRKPGELPY